MPFLLVVIFSLSIASLPKCWNILLIGFCEIRYFNMNNDMLVVFISVKKKSSQLYVCVMFIYWNINTFFSHFSIQLLIIFSNTYVRFINACLIYLYYSIFSSYVISMCYYYHHDPRIYICIIIFCFR